MKIECVLECANHLGECPVWDVEEGFLYWLDGTRALRRHPVDLAAGSTNSEDRERSAVSGASIPT
jgi:sugar lactone lactonase YvrE